MLLLLLAVGIGGFRSFAAAVLVVLVAVVVASLALVLAVARSLVVRVVGPSQPLGLRRVQELTLALLELEPSKYRARFGVCGGVRQRVALIELVLEPRAAQHSLAGFASVRGCQVGAGVACFENFAGVIGVSGVGDPSLSHVRVLATLKIPNHPPWTSIPIRPRNAGLDDETLEDLLSVD